MNVVTFGFHRDPLILGRSRDFQRLSAWKTPWRQVAKLLGQAACMLEAEAAMFAKAETSEPTSFQKASTTMTLKFIVDIHF